MKLNLSRRDFSLRAAQMMVGSVAGGALLGVGPAFAQQKAVNLGTFGRSDVQNYIRATRNCRSWRTVQSGSTPRRSARA